MTPLSDDWIQKLGPAVHPFERNQFKRRIEEGELKKEKILFSVIL